MADEISVEALYPNVIQYPQWPDEYEHPNCNLCGSIPFDHRELIHKAKGTFCHLVECDVCGFRFFAARPKWSALKPYLFAHSDMEGEATRLYEWGSFTPVDDPVKQKANIRSYYDWMFKMAVDELGHVPATMFEIAGAVGWFSVAALAAGVELVEGCDLNLYAVKVAREKHGLTGFEAGDFLDYKPHQQYEMVVALDYLEHTYHPKQDLAKIASMLVPGGVALLKTFFDEFDPDHEMLAPPVHCAHWTKPVLVREVEKAGMKVVKLREDYRGYVWEIIGRKE